MKGLPPHIDLSPLTHGSAMQLCFGANQLQIHFDNGSLIMVEGPCEIREQARPAVRIENYAGAATELCRIIGQRTVSAKRTEVGGLGMSFANGVTLNLLCDSEMFEAFQVVLRGQTFVA